MSYNSLNEFATEQSTEIKKTSLKTNRDFPNRAIEVANNIIYNCHDIFAMRLPTKITYPNYRGNKVITQKFKDKKTGNKRTVAPFVGQYLKDVYQVDNYNDIPDGPQDLIDVENLVNYVFTNAEKGYWPWACEDKNCPAKDYEEMLAYSKMINPYYRVLVKRGREILQSK